MDESAFLPTDGSRAPDTELVRAIDPSLVQSGGVLVLSSSPYAAQGRETKPPSSPEACSSSSRGWNVGRAAPDHRRGARDDVANAAADALSQ